MTAPGAQLDTIKKDRVGQIPTTQATQGFHTLHLFEGLSSRSAQGIVYMSRNTK